MPQPVISAERGVLRGRYRACIRRTKPHDGYVGRTHSGLSPEGVASLSIFGIGQVPRKDGCSIPSSRIAVSIACRGAVGQRLMHCKGEGSTDNVSHGLDFAAYPPAVYQPSALGGLLVRASSLPMPCREVTFQHIGLCRACKVPLMLETCVHWYS